MIRLHLILFLSVLFLGACSTTSSYNNNESSQKSLDEASAMNVQLAVGYIHRQQYEVAQEKLYKAIDQNSNNVDAYTTLAFLKTQLGMTEEAEEHYLDALDIKGNDPSLRNSYGAYLCRLGRFEDALEEFKEAYENPFYNTPYLAYSNAGSCMIASGDYVNAEAMLRRAIRDKPEHTSTLISMAELGLNAEKYLMARAYIQRYHALVKPSAESLWIQVQAEKALGADEHYLKYAKQLINDYPDSDQAKLVEELARNDRFKRD